jgi:cysteine desulfurase
MFELILKEIPSAAVNGSRESRVANNVHISIPGVESEFAIITLDHHGINASTKSACGAQSGGGSGVVRTLTHDDARATSTIRFTLGEETTKQGIAKAVKVLKEHVEKTREHELLLTQTPVNDIV